MCVNPYYYSMYLRCAFVGYSARYSYSNFEIWRTSIKYNSELFGINTYGDVAYILKKSDFGTYCANK